VCLPRVGHGGQVSALQVEFDVSPHGGRSRRVGRIEQIICQPMALAQDSVDLVDFPLPPAGWEAGTHGRHAGRAMGFERCIALGLPAGKTAGLAREVVERAHECVETLADVGGVDGVVVGGGVVREAGRSREAVAAFVGDVVVVPDGFGI
jgi:hypothetical protein